MGFHHQRMVFRYGIMVPVVRIELTPTRGNGFYGPPSGNRERYPYWEEPSRGFVGWNHFGPKIDDHSRNISPTVASFSLLAVFPRPPEADVDVLVVPLF